MNAIHCKTPWSQASAVLFWGETVISGGQIKFPTLFHVASPCNLLHYSPPSSPPPPLF